MARQARESREVGRAREAQEAQKDRDKRLVLRPHLQGLNGAFQELVGGR